MIPLYLLLDDVFIQRLQPAAFRPQKIPNLSKNFIIAAVADRFEISALDSSATVALPSEAVDWFILQKMLLKSDETVSPFPQ